mmetsp:Transcript_1889/g.2810  ORF Transcript_1889/g.2810 Transcript_1889/m.2810 type:complete len:198 (-) Transcript_1889:250-843(-)|eukprot:scaffold93153_cov31-Tisochrysis_lutea.AAC.3
MIAAATVAALAFSPNMAPLAAGSSVRTTMPAMMANQPIVARRELLTAFAAASVAVSPLAAHADGAASKYTREKVFIQQGSRIYRLLKADSARILEEKNAFSIFAEGAYAGLKEKKPLSKQLAAIGKKAVKAAEAGDSAAANAAVKEFVTVAQIEKEYDQVPGGSYNPTQRRNAGDPPTAAIEAQMGTAVKALYGKKM